MKYSDKFNAALKHFGYDSIKDIPVDKKDDFFEYLDSMHSAKDESELSEGKIVGAETSDLYKKRSHQEVNPVSREVADAALKDDATSVKIMSKGNKVEHGQLVGARLNLNVLKNTAAKGTPVPVMTIHKATNKEGYKKGKGFYGGEALSYHPIVTLKNAHFNVNQSAREAIASGERPKEAMASVDGEFQDIPHDKHSFDGVEVKFNPKHAHLFHDTEGRAIKRADEVTLYGHSVYARGNIEYYSQDEAPKHGQTPSKVTFNESSSYLDICYHMLMCESDDEESIEAIKKEIDKAADEIVKSKNEQIENRRKLALEKVKRACSTK